MKILTSTILILLLSLEISAQTKLTIFSEDNSIFLANLNDKNIANEGSNFFEFGNINKKTVVLKIVLSNKQKLKKTIRLQKDKQNIYSISNEDDFYEIRYRGYYGLDEKLPNFEFNKGWLYKPETVIVYKVKSDEEREMEIESKPNKLVNLNIILAKIDGQPNDKGKTKIIIEELKKGKYNSRQLKFLFSKIETDYSKLYIFKSTIDNCIDKENLMPLKSSFKSKKYKNEFKNLVAVSIAGSK
jgi:hypothetical protein